MDEYRVYDHKWYLYIRGLVLQRDDYTCQKCGKKDRLHVHHIDQTGIMENYIPPNNRSENLITLCPSCHAKSHSIKIFMPKDAVYN